MLICWFYVAEGLEISQELKIKQYMMMFDRPMKTDMMYR